MQMKFLKACMLFGFGSSRGWDLRWLATLLMQVTTMADVSDAGDIDGIQFLFLGYVTGNSVLISHHPCSFADEGK